MKNVIIFLFLFPAFCVAQIIDCREIEGRMKYIHDSLYASMYECSNYDYNLFLNNSVNSKDYSSYIPDSMNWTKPEYSNNIFVSYYGKAKAFDNFPVVNISHSSAVAYCSWLTSVYNADPKRKYKKVKFHLPSELEWKLMAQDGKISGFKRYPVYEMNGFSILGRDGAPQANFKILDQGGFLLDSSGNVVYTKTNFIHRVTNDKSGFIMSEVKSFRPTALGIYNIAGNAAEMLDESGKTRGGSWNSLGGYLLINGPDQYAGFIGSSPEIGFRVFMTVLEN